MEDPETDYTLAVPFSACASHGGPYDDEAFTAGCRFGHIWAELHEGYVAVDAVVPAPLVEQLEKLADHLGYSATTVDDGEGSAVCSFRLTNLEA